MPTSVKPRPPRSSASGSTSTGANHSLCTDATPVPGFIPPNNKYQPNPADGSDFETDDATTGWKCVKFGMNQPIYYQYHYYGDNGAAPTTVTGVTAPGGAGFAAEAVGDLDGDTTASGFARTGEIDATSQQLIVSTQVFVEDEFE